MELETREEIDAPREAVWAELVRFERFEAMVRRRKVPLERHEGDGDPSWTVSPRIAGAPREVLVTLGDQVAPEQLQALARGSGLAGSMDIRLEAIDGGRTAMTLSLALRGTSLAGKAVVGGMRVGKAQIEERFQKRVKALVQEIARHAA